jgi:hypothetical protein
MLVHQFFHQFFSVGAVGKEKKFLISPKQALCLSFPVENCNKYSIKKILDSEFEIGENI